MFFGFSGHAKIGLNYCANFVLQLFLAIFTMQCNILGYFVNLIIIYCKFFNMFIV